MRILVFCTHRQRKVAGGGADFLPFRCYPALQVCGDDIAQGAYPVITFIQAGDVTELLASGAEEGGLAFQRNLLQGFEAVTDETGADDIHPVDALLAEFFQGCRGVGLEPFGTAEARLEADLVLILFQFQRLCQQPTGFLALAVIGVAPTNSS